MRRGPPVRTAMRALSPVATRGRAASRRPRRSANRTPPYAPHVVRPCCDPYGCLAYQGAVDRYKESPSCPSCALAFPRRRTAPPPCGIEGHRRAPCSTHACCRPSAPKASSRTQRACTPACGPSRSTCSSDYSSRRPPHYYRRRAPPSA
jgi:hypothetical protein